MLYANVCLFQKKKKIYNLILVLFLLCLDGLKKVYFSKLITGLTSTQAEKRK